MSEGGTEGNEGLAAPKKKKGGKLPVLFALVVLLAGGGYFVLKLTSKGKAPKVEVKLGAIVPVKEFLVNLRGNTTYLRTEISVQLREGFEKEIFDKSLPAVWDKVTMLLCDKSLADVQSYDGKMQLKQEIANEVNKLLSASESEAKASPAGSPNRAADPKHADWQSESGPVLKVFLTSFATQ